MSKLTRRSSLERLAGLILLVLVTTTSLAPTLAIAQDADSSQLTEEQITREASRLHSKFMSPFCPGKNLKDCTSSQAAVWRDQIRDWVAEGKDEKWIEQQLIDEFGEQILSAPKFKGFNSLVWMFPFIAGVIGLGLIFSFLQRQHGMKIDKTVPARKVPENYSADPELEARLQRELDSRSR